MRKLILHHLDILNNEFCLGWCFNRALPGKPITLRLYLDKQLVAVTRCNLFRDDVHKANLRHSGRCGFKVNFQPKLDPEPGQALEIKTGSNLFTLERIASENIQKVVPHPRPVVFMHIPKTAGTSFNNHVQAWFGVDKWHTHLEVCNADEWKHLIKPGYYLAGHLPLGKIRHQVEDLETVDLHSIVRNPIDQVHSHLAWIKGIGSDTDNAFFHSHSQVVQQMALDLQSNDLSDARLIDQFVARLDGFQLDFFDNLQTRYFLGYRPDRITQQDLDKAIENLELFTAIGTTEQYAKFLAHCATLYRGKYTTTMTRHNPSRVPAIFDRQDPQIQQALKPLIRHDVLLYEVICQKSWNRSPNNE